VHIDISKLCGRANVCVALSFALSPKTTQISARFGESSVLHAIRRYTIYANKARPASVEPKSNSPKATEYLGTKKRGRLRTPLLGSVAESAYAVLKLCAQSCDIGRSWHAHARWQTARLWWTNTSSVARLRYTSKLIIFTPFPEDKGLVRGKTSDQTNTDNVAVHPPWCNRCTICRRQAHHYDDTF
jgi:hypothetical protein